MNPNAHKRTLFNPRYRMVPNMPILSSNRSAERRVGTITSRPVYLAYDWVWYTVKDQSLS